MIFALSPNVKAHADLTAQQFGNLDLDISILYDWGNMIKTCHFKIPFVNGHNILQENLLSIAKFNDFMVTDRLNTKHNIVLTYIRKIIAYFCRFKVQIKCR